LDFNTKSLLFGQLFNPRQTGMVIHFNYKSNILDILNFIFTFSNSLIINSNFVVVWHLFYICQFKDMLLS
jgi:hypothetical protein